MSDAPRERLQISEQDTLHNNMDKLNYSIFDCNTLNLPFAKTIEDCQRNQQLRTVEGIFGRGTYRALGVYIS